jgi:hypothetical protein
MFGMHAKIEKHGWTGTYVFGDGNTPAWGYTIGLAERAMHPEFAVVGLDDHSTSWLFEVLARRVTAGERLDELPGGQLELEGHPFRLVPVHASHWDTNRCNMWLEYYAQLGEGWPPQEALQVLWPDQQDRLPGDPGLDSRSRRFQTRLDRTHHVRPRDRPEQAA